MSIDRQSSLGPSHAKMNDFLYLVVGFKKCANALCNKSNGRCDIKAQKRGELESKSSHKSDIWPPAASKKWDEIY